MKRTIVSILAAMAIMASGSMASAGSGMHKDRTSDSGMYQSGTYSGSPGDQGGQASDEGMYQSGSSSGSSTDLNQGREMDKGAASDSGMYPSGADMNKEKTTGMYRSESSTDMSQGQGSFQFSNMMGKEITGMNGDKLGKVKDFVVDPNGHVFALLSTDDMGGKTVAVPFEAFSSTGMTGTGDHLSLNISKDQLASAPEFSQSTFSDRTWSEGVYRHFGIQPRWSDQGMSGQSGMGTQGSSSQGGSFQGQQSSPDQSLSGSGQGSQMDGQTPQPKTTY